MKILLKEILECLKDEPWGVLYVKADQSAAAPAESRRPDTDGGEARQPRRGERPTEGDPMRPQSFYFPPFY